MVYIDDSIMQKGSLATAGSKILENFIAPFDATVISRLAEKTERVKLAEFGLSDPGELPGVPLLCNDVFGHVRQRAARQGLCYIRPTYGTVSRYGLIPVASSMDQIGVACKNPEEGFSLLGTVAGCDENDGAMFPEKSYRYKAEAKEIKWAVFIPAATETVPGPEEFIKKAGLKGKMIDCQVKHAAVFNQVMQILAFAEISNNTSRYDGIKFGYRTPKYRNLEELYTKTRTEGFGPEAKLAAIGGCIILSQDYYTICYEKAMKIRRLIKESLRFDTYDVIVLPDDNPLAVLAGLPSLTVSYNGKGVQLAADVKQENLLLSAWEAVRS
ncbi:MAG: amidase family protein [Treponema sp.]|nr:amidase family protein [Treponema sp.]